MMNTEQLSDRREIDDLLICYCHAIDQHNWDALDEVFSDDAVIDYTAMGGPKGNLKEIKIFLAEALPSFAHSLHVIANSLVKLDGNKGTGRTLCINPLGFKLDGGVTNSVFWLWYVDEYVKTAKGWRIKSRAEEFSHADNLPEGFPLPG